MTERKIALSIEEAADYTGIGRNTLRKLVEWKKLDVYKRQSLPLQRIYRICFALDRISVPVQGTAACTDQRFMAVPWYLSLIHISVCTGMWRQQCRKMLNWERSAAYG